MFGGLGSGLIFRNTCDGRMLGSMPHCVFDISIGHPFHDEHGEELFDDEAAWRCALCVTSRTFCVQEMTGILTLVES